SHVTVRDQIIATAFMLLFADVIETRQGDPRGSANDARRRKMVSYGHRLLCDNDEDELRFRWGNSVVYRRYFQDYQHFVSRPEEIVREVFGESTDWAIVQADLSQFYDRVRPSALHQKVQTLFHGTADDAILAKFSAFFSWSWHPTNLKEVLNYAIDADPPISDFDESVSRDFDQWFDVGSWQLVDFCRYVDDMRIVVRLGHNLIHASDQEIRDRVLGLLTRLLEQ